MLKGLEFLTSAEVILPELTYLDISRNQLDDLKNLVAAPKLEQLRMSGSADTNRLVHALLVETDTTGFFIY